MKVKKTLPDLNMGIPCLKTSASTAGWDFPGVSLLVGF